MKAPQISVIVPIYKVEEYLDRCIQSILNQSFTNIEVILVDDGSPDNCGELCEEFARRDNRVRVIHKENGGLSSARNAGIEAAQGTYLAFVDSDDWIDLDMLELLYTAIHKYDAQIAECSFRSIYQDRVEEETACTGGYVLAGPVEALEGMYDWKNFKIVAWNKLYHRDVIGKIRYPVERLHEDEFTTYRFAWNAQRLVFVDASKYNYNCTRANSIMTQQFREGHLDACFALRERVDFLREHGVTQLEQKSIDIYCFILFDRLYKAYRAGIKSKKLQQVLKMAAEDAREFQNSNISAHNLETLQLISSKGLRAFGKRRDRQEGR